MHDISNIKNQIAIIYSYIKESPELALVNAYADNGISGITLDHID